MVPIKSDKTPDRRPALRDWRQDSSGIDKRIRESQLDEGLTRDADAPGFSIDRTQQVDGKVDVDALDLAAGRRAFDQSTYGVMSTPESASWSNSSAVTDFAFSFEASRFFL
jgi:hypothetical protein